MKKLVLFLFLGFNAVINAQEPAQTMSSAARFSNSAGKIIRNSILYDEHYYANLGLLKQNIALVKFHDYAEKDSILGLKFYGEVRYTSLSNQESMTKKYSVILDFGELDNMIAWVDLINKGNVIDKTSNKEQLTFTPKYGSLLLRYYNGHFEVQYDRLDDNSIILLGTHSLENFYKNLIEIKNLIGANSLTAKSK